MPTRPSPAPPPERVDAIICDIDGCLSPETPSPTDLAGLQRIAEHNRRAVNDTGVPPLTLCTGRPLPFCEAVARAVGAFALPAICEGGVWMLEMNPYRWTMDPRITPEHLAMIAEMKSWIDTTFDGVFFEAGKSAAVTVFHHTGPEILKEGIEPAIADEIARRELPLRTAMTWTCVNVELDFISKATGIDRMLTHADLDPGHLVGIGDTLSDIPIRERVAWFACPGNADERLKAHADYVSPHDEVEGVLDILDRLSPSGRDHRS